MPFLVRDRLFIGDINDAANVLLCRNVPEITHLLSLLSSSSMSFFTEWRPGLEIQSKEIRQVFERQEDESEEGLKDQGRVLGLLEMAGEGLQLVRMAVPLRDMESENLLDYLDLCLDYIDKSRSEGSILVHCFAGVSRRMP